MRQLFEDLYVARNIKAFNDYRMYKSSNEYLEYIFKNLAIKDKKVLSVLASSDQVLLFNYYQAKKVDTFDINRLTKYYYYLRKWCIEQEVSIYPYRINGRTIQEVVDGIIPSDEEEKKAQIFWHKLLEEDVNKLKGELFFSSSYEPLSKFNLKELKQGLKTGKMAFEDIDILEESDFKDDYDIVYMSNILQRTENKKKLQVCMENLKKITKAGGVVVCSNFFDWGSMEKIRQEKEIFADSFSLDVYKDYNPIMGINMPIYYTYTKK